MNRKRCRSVWAARVGRDISESESPAVAGELIEQTDWLTAAHDRYRASNDATQDLLESFGPLVGRDIPESPVSTGDLDD
jgi:hypothetical protein